MSPRRRPHLVPPGLLAFGLLLAACAPAAPPVEGDSPAPSGDSAPPLPEDDPLEEVPDAPQGWLSATRGFYHAPVTISSPAPALGLRALYTLDGRDPLGPTGQALAEPLTLDATAVLRLAVLDPGGGLVARETHTYFFPDAVPDQAAPADWPATWWADEDGGPYLADYGMDPAITGAASWAEARPLEALPLLSLVLPPEDLFDPATGIHEHPLERGDAWERAVSLELLSPDGAEAVQVDAGLRVQGGAGRRADRSPKKSFRLAFRAEYGASRFEHPVFPDSAQDRYDSLVIRAGYNRTWANWQDSQRERSQYARERFTQELYRDMGHLTPRVRPAHLLLNGLYWGLVQIEERPDAAFLADHLGGDEDDYDAINSGEVSDGDGEAWQALMDCAEAVAAGERPAAELMDLLDVPAFIDYMLLNLYLGNRDWPHKNWWAGRRRAEGARWRFFVWDAELTMSEPGDDLIDSAADPNGPGLLFQALRPDLEFRVGWADAAMRHLHHGGLLTPEVIGPRWVAESARVVPAVLAESARWGDHWASARGEGSTTYTYDTHWLAEQERLVERYLPVRRDRFLEQLAAAGLTLPTAAPELAPHGGAPGQAVTLSGPGQVFYTLDGQDPRLPGGGLSPEALEATGPVELTEPARLCARALDAQGWSPIVCAEFVSN